MAKVIGPALSIQASGSIGRILTFVNSGRRAIARRLGPASRSATPAQLSIRAHHRDGTAAWHDLLPGDRQAWDDYGRLNRQTGYAAFLSDWLSNPPTPAGTIWDSGATRWDNGVTSWDVP